MEFDIPVLREQEEISFFFKDEEVRGQFNTSMGEADLEHLWARRIGTSMGEAHTPLAEDQAKCNLGAPLGF